MTIADIRPALRSRLIADAAVSTLAGQRVYPVRLPQGTTQASVVYSRISGLGDHHSQGPSGLSRPRMQIDCWAPTHDAAAALANAVKECIDGFRGDITDSNSPDVVTKVQGIFFDSEREDYDDAAKLYRVSRDYLIWYEER